MIHQYLSHVSYWGRGRTFEEVETSINNSLCFGVYLDHVQVGFARVVTDYSIFAGLFDVFIIPQYRGQSLGKKLMYEIVNHPQLIDIKSWHLGTKDAHGLYEQFGFTKLKNTDIIMEKRTIPIEELINQHND